MVSILPSPHAAKPAGHSQNRQNDCHQTEHGTRLRRSEALLGRVARKRCSEAVLKQFAEKSCSGSCPSPKPRLRIRTAKIIHSRSHSRSIVLRSQMTPGSAGSTQRWPLTPGSGRLCLRPRGTVGGVIRRLHETLEDGVIQHHRHRAPRARQDNGFPAAVGRIDQLSEVFASLGNGEHSHDLKAGLFSIMAAERGNGVPASQNTVSCPGSLRSAAVGVGRTQQLAEPKVGSRPPTMGVPSAGGVRPWSP